MEKLPEVKMFKGEFAWNDLGSWSTVYQLTNKDDHNNVAERKNNILIDSENTMLFSTTDKPVAAIGLKNVAVINTQNGVLVADMDQLQRVKEVIRKLEEEQKREVI
jgi:mannose-1-phosphate guanylyltransferase